MPFQNSRKGYADICETHIKTSVGLVSTDLKYYDLFTPNIRLYLLYSF